MMYNLSAAYASMAFIVSTFTHRAKLLIPVCFLAI